MNILYLNLDRGIPVQGDKGASVHVRAFVTAAAALGHQVTLVCPSLGTGNPPPPATILHLPLEADDTALRAMADAWSVPPEALDDHVTRRELARLAYDHSIGDRVAAALERTGWRPDLVYERHALFHAAGAAIARRLGLPRLLEVNAPLIEEQRRFRGLRLEAAARVTEIASYQGADAVIAVSQAVAQHVAAVLGRADRVHTIPNGVDLRRFTMADGAGATIRRQLGLGRAPVVGFVGSFKAWHGMLFLLDVVAGLEGPFHDLRLLAVGDGPEREAVLARAQAYGIADRVILPGRIPHHEIAGWLGAMDITVAPYLPLPDFYFSPLKIVESLAAGRPVIAPALGEIPELVTDGLTGLLYEPGDLQACRAALHRLLADAPLRTAMGQQASRSVAGRDWREVVARSLALVGPQPVQCDAA